MSKNEKVIMGVLMGGIFIFLVLSVFLLFTRGERDLSSQIPTSAGPQQRVNTTPYPTIPPIEDMTVMINERRLNPQSVTIKSGNAISFFNIGASAIIIEGADENSDFLNFSVPESEAFDYVFRNPGNYTYRVRGTTLVGTITIQ